MISKLMDTSFRPWVSVVPSGTGSGAGQASTAYVYLDAFNSKTDLGHNSTGRCP